MYSHLHENYETMFPSLPMRNEKAIMYLSEWAFGFHNCMWAYSGTESMHRPLYWNVE